MDPMTPTDAARIAEIRERVEKATPGRWACWNAYGCAGGTHPADSECVHVARLGPAEVDARMGIVADGGRGDLNGHRDDFQFLAHAREDVPWLLDQIAALTAEVERLVGLAQEVWDSVPSSYDENDPMVRRHAAALNALGAALTQERPA